MALCVAPYADLAAFFEENVEEACAERGLAAPPEATAYVVSLLTDLSTAHGPAARSLVELELEARTGSRHARLDKLRGLGDHALSYASLFDAHRARRGLSREYVERVGSFAYREACTLLDDSSSACQHGPAWRELGSRFSAYAEILEEVRERTTLGTPDDLVALYECFVRTGSEALRRRLARHGLFALDPNDDDVS